MIKPPVASPNLLSSMAMVEVTAPELEIAVKIAVVFVMLKLRIVLLLIDKVEGAALLFIPNEVPAKPVTEALVIKFALMVTALPPPFTIPLIVEAAVPNTVVFATVLLSIFIVPVAPLLIPCMVHIPVVVLLSPIVMELASVVLPMVLFLIVKLPETPRAAMPIKLCEEVAAEIVEKPPTILFCMLTVALADAT